MDTILTAREAADRLRVSMRTLDRLAKTEAGPPQVRLSVRRLGYREIDILKFIDAGGIALPAA